MCSCLYKERNFADAIMKENPLFKYEEEFKEPY